MLALLVWPAPRASAQTVTVDTVGEALKIRAPGFSFLKGDPLARLKDGRSVRVELAAMVLPAPGKVAGGDDPADLRVELRSLGGTIRRDDGGRARPSVSHLMMAAAEAWCVEQLAIPVSALGALGRDLPFWIRLEYRILDGDGASDADELGLHAAGADRRVEPAPQDRVIAAAFEAGPFRLPSRGSSSPR